MRLIDADALKAVIEEEEKGLEIFEFQLAATAFINHIEEAPTINAVPKQHLVNWVCVTRCKECKHSQYDELFHMRWCHGDEVKDDDFCSYGEKKDDER